MKIARELEMQNYSSLLKNVPYKIAVKLIQPVPKVRDLYPTNHILGIPVTDKSVRIKNILGQSVIK